jgi:hypothetical protein
LTIETIEQALALQKTENEQDDPSLERYKRYEVDFSDIDMMRAI